MRSKFNVSSSKGSRTYDGIVFDSKLEMQYYIDIIEPGFATGEIIMFERQKKYELQPSFVHKGTKIRAIYYVADFYVEYANGDTVAIDIKGFPTETAKLKRKMFWYAYPYIRFEWVTYKHGKWIEVK